MKFRYTILYVADVRAALNFYHAAFGFEIAFLHDSKDYGELVTGETKLAFAACDLIRQLGEEPLAVSPKSPAFGLSFETDDVARDLERALSAGATLEKPVAEQPWVQTTCSVSDKDGYLIEICSPVARDAP
ncbi:VOC family protein [Cognatiyoonia sp. IB215446]|uniref:VOC family protein n=1 Tax=Cognatiyoonia sp. IB215446 TaxID=3097355 RepID=UPI002A10F92C|nr:VOC family protein [Cognatiyoonia sp. IB215446]MDX8350199.1 VOC family protein [Cognatiyoonia sp. IB215446]